MGEESSTSADWEKGLVISKLDAARRQLETAIRLYFHNGDPVSIHTLTAAAYNVIRDITGKRGAPPMLLKDKIFEVVKPEYQTEFRNLINKAENFFKHGDKDHEATLVFNPLLTEILLLDACSQYLQITGEDLPLFVVYRTWHMAQHVEHFQLPTDTAEQMRVGKLFMLKQGRLGYFNASLPNLMKI